MFWTRRGRHKYTFRLEINVKNSDDIHVTGSISFGGGRLAEDKLRQLIFDSKQLLQATTNAIAATNRSIRGYTTVWDHHLVRTRTCGINQKCSGLLDKGCWEALGWLWRGTSHRCGSTRISLVSLISLHPVDPDLAADMYCGLVINAGHFYATRTHPGRLSHRKGWKGWRQPITGWLNSQTGAR